MSPLLTPSPHLPLLPHSLSLLSLPLLNLNDGLVTLTNRQLALCHESSSVSMKSAAAMHSGRRGGGAQGGASMGRGTRGTGMQHTPRRGPGKAPGTAAAFSSGRSNKKHGGVAQGGRRVDPNSSNSVSLAVPSVCEAAAAAGKPPGPQQALRNWTFGGWVSVPASGAALAVYERHHPRPVRGANGGERDSAALGRRAGRRGVGKGVFMWGALDGQQGAGTAKGRAGTGAPAAPAELAVDRSAAAAAAGCLAAG